MNLKLRKPRLKIRGSTKINSTSKIKNTIVIKKKLRENGKRSLLSKSNPHSNTEYFSRSSFVKDIKIRLTMLSNDDSTNEIVINI